MENARYPIIFVTGIGQTWSSLKTDSDHRWNLFPGDREVLFKNYPKGGKCRLAKLCLQAVGNILTGFPKIKQQKIDQVVADLFRYCRVDENGKLPEEVNVRLYGAKNFSELLHTDFATGEYTDDEAKSLGARMYRDIPCKSLAKEYGEELMFCFNYSTFSDLYASADRLHRMIKDVLNKVNNGADKVILIPMSMGATVVNAYLDKYYTDQGAIEHNMVAKVVSIVGAWNGSDGLADILMLNGGKDFDHRLYDEMLPSILKEKSWLLRLVNKKAADKLLSQLVDGLLNSVLLRISSFMALLPYERFEQAEKRLFTEERMKNNPRAKAVYSEAIQYHNAQGNLKNRLTGLAENCGMEFYFICGYGMPLGAGSNDFKFLGLFDSARKTNSDGVIGVSSTAPGTNGDSLPESNEGAWFKNHCWYFTNQPHELGSNNTALKLAIGIASGEITEPNGDFPMVNDSRDVRKAEKLVLEAHTFISDSGGNDELCTALKAVEDMLACTHNHREADDALTSRLEQLLKQVS